VRKTEVLSHKNKTLEFNTSIANTYTKLYVQLVFAVKGREGLIQQFWREKLYKYTNGIVQNNGHKMLQINGMPDHVHIFIGYNVNQKIPDLVEHIKTDSNHYIKGERFCKCKFQWQSGYEAFTYSRSQIGRVVKYIENQEDHHREKTFIDKYTTMLARFEVEYNEPYLATRKQRKPTYSSSMNIHPLTATITVLFMTILMGCSEKNCTQPTGAWTNREGQSLVFNPEGKGLWLTRFGFTYDTVTFSYLIDCKKDPTTIDLKDFNEGTQMGQTLYGIIEMGTDSSFRIRYESGADPSVRPVAFDSDQTVKFFRK